MSSDNWGEETETNGEGTTGTRNNRDRKSGRLEGSKDEVTMGEMGGERGRTQRERGEISEDGMCPEWASGENGQKSRPFAVLPVAVTLAFCCSLALSCLDAVPWMTSLVLRHHRGEPLLYTFQNKCTNSVSLS